MISGAMPSGSQFANVMREVLPGREWTVLSPRHPIFHTVFDLDGDAADSCAAFREPGGSTAEYAGAHKYPAGLAR